MRHCSKCKRDLPLSEFNKRGAGKQPWCRECNRKRSRQYYAENREKHIQVIRVRTDQIILDCKQKLCEYLSTHPCVDCGNSDIRVLDFDHLGDKEAHVTRLFSHGWKRMMREIQKCEVVCANCHRIRTAERDGRFYRSIYLQASEALSG